MVKFKQFYKAHLVCEFINEENITVVSIAAVQEKE